MPVTDPKTVKNRVHLHLTSAAADRDHEIDRLPSLGTCRADIGQTGTESWTVPYRLRGSKFLSRACEGNAHPLRLSTENRGRPCRGMTVHRRCLGRVGIPQPEPGSSAA
jgi:hypothetical protein